MSNIIESQSSRVKVAHAHNDELSLRRLEQEIIWTVTGQPQPLAELLYSQVVLTIALAKEEYDSKDSKSPFNSGYVGRFRYYGLPNLIATANAPTCLQHQEGDGHAAEFTYAFIENLIYGAKDELPSWTYTACLADVFLMPEMRGSGLAATMFIDHYLLLTLMYQSLLKIHKSIPICSITSADNIAMQKSFIRSFPKSEVISDADHRILRMNTGSGKNAGDLQLPDGYTVSSIFDIHRVQGQDLKTKPLSFIPDAVYIRNNGILTGLVLNSISTQIEPAPIAGNSILLLSPEATLEEISHTLQIYSPFRRHMIWGAVILPEPNKYLERLNSEELTNFLAPIHFYPDKKNVLLRATLTNSLG